MYRRIAALAGLLLAATGLSVLTAGPAHADQSQEDCFSRIDGFGPDCATARTQSGWQADGSGVYLDSITVSCRGQLENDPAFNGHDLVVMGVNRAGDRTVLWRHENPNVNQESGNHFCNERVFGSTQDRWKAYRIWVRVDGVLRRNSHPDRDVYHSMCIGDAASTACF